MMNVKKLSPIWKQIRKYETIGVMVYFAIGTALMTWPLICKMNNSIVGQVGDNVYFIWMIGWFKKALFNLHVNPFNVWFLNYPQGWSMAYTEITPAQLALALPFSFLSTPTFAYNMAMLITFFLSGVGMYMWARRLTDKPGAALIAGTIFAFVPYRFAHFLVGHLNLSGTQWFPFYFWGMFELMDPAKRPTWKHAALAGVALGLIALTSQYYIYMTLLITAFIMVIYFVFYQRKKIIDWHLWKLLGLTMLIALPLVLVAVAPYATLSQVGGLPDRNLAVVRQYSASPTDFLLPSIDHFLLGSWIGTHFNRDLWIEATLYIGFFTSGLAILAWVKRRQVNKPWIMPLLLWGSLAAIILAMGTDLHWNGNPVELSLPINLANKLGRDNITLYLPGYFLFRFFPFYAKLRALMRFGIFAIMFFSATAGLGAAWLLGRIKPKWIPLATAGMIFLILFDFYPGAYKQFSPVQPRAVDVWLAEQPGSGAVIQFPFSESEDQEQTYFTLEHGKPFVGGFFNAFPPEQYKQISPIMENFPDPASIAMLTDLGVQYILVDITRYPDKTGLRSSCETLGLKFVIELDGEMVFTP